MAKKLIGTEDPFETFWKAYGRRGSKQEAKREWSKLDEEERRKALFFVQHYVKETPDLKYRLHACRYLKRRIFNDIEERLEAVGVDTKADWTPPYTRHHLRQAVMLPDDVVATIDPHVASLARLAKRIALTRLYTDVAMQDFYDEMIAHGVLPEEATAVIQKLKERNMPSEIA